MQALLQRASQALSANDANMLEELAVVVSAMRVLPPDSDLKNTARAAEILRQQVRAASGHLALRRRLEARSQAGGSLWAL